MKKLIRRIRYESDTTEAILAAAVVILGAWVITITYWIGVP